eukprot:CAMPEP_0201488258 /NCGR_PEP_ID=MMETSP0151_2-20130828/17853_1 /ASSEMBLY_ACC=CAM_ASM_000257 /TAXON_ID=200890 /ORGANISM="Paramoeba atlantica, Strain 621/1 / CCAP 1560/9" /LENGTH=507 /DNA_ID=CAMNT_0047873515 /DNA_START=94 /DNA_END=1617 /DNA_ORIENTATION=-
MDLFSTEILVAFGILLFAFLYQFGEWVWIILRQVWIHLQFRQRFGRHVKDFETYKARGFNWKADYFSQKEGDYDYFIHNQLEEKKPTIYLGPDGEYPAFSSMDPDLIETVMKDINSYPRGPTIEPLFTEVMGIPLPEGAEWFKLKRLLLPIFYGDNLSSHTSQMDRNTLKAIERFESLAGGPIRLVEPLSLFSMGVMVSLCFGDRFETDEVVTKFLDVFSDVSEYMMMYALSGPTFTKFTSRYRKQQKKMKVFHAAIQEVIDKERALGEDLSTLKNSSDLLKNFLFVEQKNEDMNQWMADQIVNQIVMFLFAGMDTSATMLQTVIHFLATNPRVVEKCREEANRVAPDEGMTPEQAEELKYCSAVISETLRLNPGIFVDRQVAPQTGLEHKGMFFPQGSIIMFNTQAVMEDSEHWGDDSRQFVPERWLEINEKTMNPNHFPMFGAKSKAQCPGQKFAQHEMKIFLARFAQRFNVEEILENGLPFFCTNQGISKPAPHVKYVVRPVNK